MMHTVQWNKEGTLDQLADADAYLSLILDSVRVAKLVSQLRTQPVKLYRCNDVFRALQRRPLPIWDAGVRATRRHIAAGESLDPLFYVSWSGGQDIADGFHRLSALWHRDKWSYVHMVSARVNY